MVLENENENGNVKWIKSGELKFRIETKVQKSIVAVVLNGYNIALKLMMYDFIEKIKEDLSLNVLVEKSWISQRVFAIDSERIYEFLNYLSEFVVEWNIKITDETFSHSDIISESSWYEETDDKK